MANDTLTLSPHQSYASVSGRYYWSNVDAGGDDTLVIDAKGVDGVALPAQTLHYPLDNDGDGIPDFQDACPLDPACN